MYVYICRCTEHEYADSGQEEEEEEIDQSQQVVEEPGNIEIVDDSAAHRLQAALIQSGAVTLATISQGGAVSIDNTQIPSSNMVSQSVSVQHVLVHSI